jgi:L-amino acid N-acyltransferase YncA
MSFALPGGPRNHGPHARRRRWEEDGWSGADSSQLAVALPDRTLAGIVACLQAITDVENIAEQRVLEHIGFRREGIMRGLAFDAGRWHDGVLYARLRDDPA